MARHLARGNRGTVGQHDFAMVPRAEIPRSVFNRSHSLKTSFGAGTLIPVFVDEALPGDTMRMNASAFCRMATPIFPLMDNLYLDWFFFAVPYRLVWENWERFNGAQDNPGDSTDFLLPQMTEVVTVSSLSDYLGIPSGLASLTFCSLWHRAYNKIYNDWFRDENLQDSVVVDLDDGPDTFSDYSILRRGKRHDYFTSCLPFLQKGDPVSLPLGISAPLVGVPNITGLTVIGAGDPTFTVGGAGARSLGSNAATTAVNWSGAQPALDASATWDAPALDVGGSISLAAVTADLSAATAATINDIRQAFQIQRLLERDARGGTRYTEIVRSHFGVVSPDARMQRPEYLGGGSSPINVHPVARTTAGTTGAGPGAPAQANLGAFVTTSNDRVGFVKSFTEHCLILGIVNIRADLTYQQGIERMFSRRTRFDMYWPALSHLGEQAVLNSEIFAQGTADDDLVFGYQERYAEYRYKPSRTSASMRSTASTPIDTWHLAQEFSALPLLNDAFIVDDPPMDRVQALQQTEANPSFFGDFWFDIRHARPMPTYGVPGFVDHF